VRRRRQDFISELLHARDVNPSSADSATIRPISQTARTALNV